MPIGTATVQRGTPLRRSHSLSPRAASSLTGGGGPVLRSPLAGQRAAGLAGNSLRAACVLPVFADGSGVPVSQELRRLPSAREVLIIFPCEERAAGARRRRNTFNAPPGPGATPGKQSRMAESSACGVKDPSISQPPGDTQAQSVQTALGIAARATRTVWRTSKFSCCQDRAQTRSQEYRSTANPREQGRGASMPRGITGLGSRGHQALSHGPQAAWRSYGRGHDCGTPVCGHLQLGAGCLPVRLCARPMLPLQHTRPAPL
ncbi:hypothetical protein TCDM_09960 [Trypanosoma cruzi Dm28c]|uniref:Uncharacterized protein n=1 Tax=Trypanosoma cruzi Dm28c TaxID=1416333 RepID=V5D4F6_TRYCR|nr:hypothetical protein TCDM_09960 [Trypanosoma cruzi Dm28c]